jgi:hypothetical protein
MIHPETSIGHLLKSLEYIEAPSTYIKIEPIEYPIPVLHIQFTGFPKIPTTLFRATTDRKMANIPENVSGYKPWQVFLNELSLTIQLLVEANVVGLNQFPNSDEGSRVHILFDFSQVTKQIMLAPIMFDDVTAMPQDGMVDVLIKHLLKLYVRKELTLPDAKTGEPRLLVDSLPLKEDQVLFTQKTYFKDQVDPALLEELRQKHQVVKETSEVIVFKTPLEQVQLSPQDKVLSTITACTTTKELKQLLSAIDLRPLYLYLPVVAHNGFLFDFENKILPTVYRKEIEAAYDALRKRVAETTN